MSQKTIAYIGLLITAVLAWDQLSRRKRCKPAPVEAVHDVTTPGIVPAATVAARDLELDRTKNPTDGGVPTAKE